MINLVEIEVFVAKIDHREVDNVVIRAPFFWRWVFCHGAFWGTLTGCGGKISTTGRA